MTELSIEQLFLFGRELKAPCAVLLADGGVLRVEAILRILPGKRLVVKGRLFDASAESRKGNTTAQLVKIFQERANWQQEINGYRLLEKTGINTPKMLRQNVVGSGGICCYEYLDDLQSAETRWQQAANESAKTDLLQQLLSLLTQLYRGGVRQRDLHLNNFMFRGQTLYALDPADCIPLQGDDEIRHNLAILLTQLPLADWPMAIPLIAVQAPGGSYPALKQQADNLWQLRKKNYLQKIFRDCTEVADLGAGSRRALCKRSALSKTFLALLDNPDAAIATGEIIKDGRSSTVAKVMVGETSYVVKRYHNKDKFTALRRWFSKNRAHNNWYFAHLLKMAGIHTPPPIAILERRQSLLDYSSYYISEYIPADNAYNIFVRQPPSATQLQQIKNIFSALDHMQVLHGDCKSTNWLVDKKNIWLVDLDAMSETTARAAIDRERFLRDWKNHPALLAQFAATLATQENG